MAWPPRVGELLPRADEAAGVRRKLIAYSLNQTHEMARPKARGFALILGIGIDHVDYLESEVLRGILTEPVCAVRANPPYGVNCVVEIPIRGIGTQRKRVAPVRTIWELTARTAAPRLISAFPKI